MTTLPRHSDGYIFHTQQGKILRPRNVLADFLTKVVDYAYDVFNRLVAKSVDDDGDESVDRQESYVYDGQHVALKFARADGDPMAVSDLATRYLHGPAVDMVLVEERVHYASGDFVTDDLLWMFADNQGTVRDVAI